MVGYLYSDQDRLDELIPVWQERLRLQDWDVVGYVKRRNDMPMGYEDCDGCCFANPHHKQATIHIRAEEDHEDKDFKYDLEAILVHELLEIHLCPIYVEEDPLMLMVKEQAVDLLSRAFIKAYRGNHL